MPTYLQLCRAGDRDEKVTQDNVAGEGFPLLAM